MNNEICIFFAFFADLDQLFPSWTFFWEILEKTPYESDLLIYFSTHIFFNEPLVTTYWYATVLFRKLFRDVKQQVVCRRTFIFNLE